MEQKEEDPEDILRETHPDWSPEQLKEAEEALDQYFEVVMRIYDRIRKDPRAYEEFKATIEERKKKTTNL